MDISKLTFIPASSRTWPELLSIDQTAQILGVNKMTLRRWDNKGIFKAVRIVTHRRYRKLDVIKATQEGVKENE